ncbi:MAG: hypothetical protein S4CHLAM20_11170 [Chlamydiia bacterium]|nr:hypothetical protein [Chlamydiia bacterium]
MRFFLFLSSIYLSYVYCNDPAFEAVIQYLPTNPIIIEAGGHDGSSSCKMIEQWPDAVIHSFECNPKVYKLLEKNTSEYPNIHTYQLGLGDSDGYADFHLSSSANPRDKNPFDAQSSFNPPNPDKWGWSVIVFKETVKVPVVKLDTWVEKNKVDHVDFIWLDTQGFEYNILSSAPKILRTVKAIKTEFSDYPFYKNTVCFKPYCEWLESQGFVCIYRDNKNHGDAAFVRKELLKN